MFVKIFADGGLVAVLLIAGVVGAWWLVRSKPDIRRVAATVIMAGLTSLFVGKILSLLPVQAVRPFTQHGVTAGAAYINNPGFPSDHALLATVVVMALYCLTPYKKTSYVLMVIAGLMAVARVLALVHTPIDILGGIFAGLAGTVWYYKHKREHI